MIFLLNKRPKLLPYFYTPDWGESEPSPLDNLGEIFVYSFQIPCYLLYLYDKRKNAGEN